MFSRVWSAQECCFSDGNNNFHCNLLDLDFLLKCLHKVSLISTLSGIPLKAEGNYLKQNLRNISELERLMETAEPSSDSVLEDTFS